MLLHVRAENIGHKVAGQENQPNKIYITDQKKPNA